MTYYGNISTPSNRADWIDTVQVLDDDTGEPIDLSTCSITMTVTNRRRNPNAYRYGMGGYYGPLYLDLIILTGSTASGEITVVDLGTFQWHFTAGQMNNMPQGEYIIGVRITQDDQSIQVMIGTVIVMEGIDMQ
jgi:hypothetical protein